MTKRISYYENFFFEAFDSELKKTKNMNDSVRAALVKTEKEFLKHEKINIFYLRDNLPVYRSVTSLRIMAHSLNRKWRGVCCAIDSGIPNLYRYVNLNFMYRFIRREFERYHGMCEVLLDNKAFRDFQIDMVIGFTVVFGWKEKQMYNEASEV